jgi:prevent-host-death family protein
MSTHSVAEAKNKLPELIDRALAGEGIVITRHGRPVVELRPIQKQPGPITDEALAWLAAQRAKLPRLDKLNAAELVSQLRDEDEERLDFLF